MCSGDGQLAIDENASPKWLPWREADGGGVKELRDHLSRYLDRVRGGDAIAANHPRTIA
jgi:hypothetical protein